MSSMVKSELVAGMGILCIIGIDETIVNLAKIFVQFYSLVFIATINLGNVNIGNNSLKFTSPYFFP
jgi:hypothetical protein